MPLSSMSQNCHFPATKKKKKEVGAGGDSSRKREEIRALVLDPSFIKVLSNGATLFPQAPFKG